jgi:exosome complex RNA-binding protein Rrp4
MKNHLLCFNINNIEVDCILGTNGYVWIYKNDPQILEA